MICFDCMRENKKATCQYCGKCAHICKTNCHYYVQKRNEELARLKAAMARSFEKFCEHCGKIFHKRVNSQTTCSRECRDEMMATNTSSRAIDIPVKLEGVEHCDYCGNACSYDNSKVKCAHCKKTYHGTFCDDCSIIVSTQTFCEGKEKELSGIEKKLSRASKSL